MNMPSLKTPFIRLQFQFACSRHRTHRDANAMFLRKQPCKLGDKPPLDGAAKKAPSRHHGVLTILRERCALLPLCL